MTMPEPYIMPLWVTPVYLGEIDSANSYATALNSFEWVRPEVDNGYITRDINLLNDHIFANLKKEIEHHIDIYTRDICKFNNNVEFYITNSWGVKHQKDDWAGRHYHVNSLFSGIVYIECDDNSGDLVFYKGTTHKTITPVDLEFEHTEWNMFNSTTHTITPKQNQIVIFPSHVEHSVNNSNNEKDRLALPFNVYFKGSLGKDHYETLNKLEIK
jgi:uncharacterized protein (TIGR02466 family)